MPLTNILYDEKGEEEALGKLKDYILKDKSKK